MSTSIKITSFLNSFKNLNRYGFDFRYSSDSISDEFLLTFEFPVHCAMFYTLLHEMLIENTSVYLENSKTVRILVIKYDNDA